MAAMLQQCITTVSQGKLGRGGKGTNFVQSSVYHSKFTSNSAVQEVKMCGKIPQRVTQTPFSRSELSQSQLPNTSVFQE